MQDNNWGGGEKLNFHMNPQLSPPKSSPQLTDPQLYSCTVEGTVAEGRVGGQIAEFQHTSGGGATEDTAL